MSNNSIAFLDSGVGGLPYLKDVRDLREDLSYIYFADAGNFPYGIKESNDLIEILVERARFLIEEYHPALMVIACNTASVTALKTLREKFAIPFVGVVPAVKPAAEQSRNKRIGILATEGTTKGPYMDWLEESFASDCTVFREAAGDIVDLVENSFFTSNTDDQLKLIDRAVKSLKKENIDTLVLGCTHFIYVREQIQFLAGEKINVIDSRKGVTQQILRMVKNSNIKPRETGNALLIHSGNTKDVFRYTHFADYFKLDYQGLIK